MTNEMLVLEPDKRLHGTISILIRRHEMVGGMPQLSASLQVMLVLHFGSPSRLKCGQLHDSNQKSDVADHLGGSGCQHGVCIAKRSLRPLFLAPTSDTVQNLDSL